MTIDAWLQSAIADAEKRGMPELKPILETLARSTRALRAMAVNDDASGNPQSAIPNPQSALAGPQSPSSSPQSEPANPQSAIRTPQSEGGLR